MRDISRDPHGHLGSVKRNIKMAGRLNFRDGTDLSNYDSIKSRRGVAAFRKIGRPAQLECKDGPDVE